uniref:CCHC-type domain-containing protein n=1 Tax=Cannabis sativa TaxID=3483 RepID=A0A803Q2L2_CANSA
MAKKTKMARKGKSKGKKIGPSSSDRVIKTRFMDVVLGIQELEIQETEDSMEQCEEPMEYILEGLVRRLWKDEVVKVGLLAKGIFIISFQSLEQRDNVMQQGPRHQVLGESSLFKIVGQLWEPLQVDNVTKNRDKLQYPRILTQVSLSQDFPDKIAFIDEFNHELELDVKYEWMPLVCYNCSGIGHSTKDCRKKEEKKELRKHIWVPKQKVIEKEKQVDAEGF